MTTLKEAWHRTRRLHQNLDRLSMVGQGWSEATPGQFMFNPPPTGILEDEFGACCHWYGCEDSTYAECIADENYPVWMGAGTRCEDVECPVGACCCPDDPECFISTQGLCEACCPVCEYQGDFTECDPNPCANFDCTLCEFTPAHVSGSISETWTSPDATHTWSLDDDLVLLTPPCEWYVNTGIDYFECGDPPDPECPCGFQGEIIFQFLYSVGSYCRWSAYFNFSISLCPSGALCGFAGYYEFNFDGNPTNIIFDSTEIDPDECPFCDECPWSVNITVT